MKVGVLFTFHEDFLAIMAHIILVALSQMHKLWNWSQRQLKV